MRPIEFRISPASNRCCHCASDMLQNLEAKNSIAGSLVFEGTPTVLGPTPFLMGGLNALKDDIPHTMPQFQATIFKLGERSVVWLDGIATQIARRRIF